MCSLWLEVLHLCAEDLLKEYTRCNHLDLLKPVFRAKDTIQGHGIKYKMYFSYTVGNSGIIEPVSFEIANLRGNH